MDSIFTLSPTDVLSIVEKYYDTTMTQGAPGANGVGWSFTTIIGVIVIVLGAVFLGVRWLSSNGKAVARAIYSDFKEMREKENTAKEAHAKKLEENLEAVGQKMHDFEKQGIIRDFRLEALEKGANSTNGTN